MPQLDANCVGCQKMTAVINTGAVYGARRMRGAGGFPRFYRGGTDQGNIRRCIINLIIKMHNYKNLHFFKYNFKSN